MSGFASWIEHYGTLGVFFVTAAEGEMGVLLGGTGAKLGEMPLLSVVLATWMGAFLSAIAFFAIGRSSREGRMVHKVTDKRAFALALKWVDRHPRLFCFFYRFVYGLRIVGPVTISLSHIRWQTFVLINLVSALVWACAGTAVGYWVGADVVHALMRWFSWRWFLMASIAVVAVALMWISHRARRRAQSSSAATPISPDSTAV